jgi:hypothetical protein
MEELITEEQILALTNTAKRAEFLDTWPEWPVLAEVPVLQLTVRQIVLPNKQRIVSLEYASTQFKDYRHCYFQRLHLTEGIGPYSDNSTSPEIEMLKNLRMEIVKQREKEHES